MKHKMEKAPMQPAEVFYRHVEYAAEVGGDLNEFSIPGAGTSDLRFIM